MAGRRPPNRRRAHALSRDLTLAVIRVALSSSHGSDKENVSD